MPVDRPTFSESWYRVASLRPRLLSTVQTYRQHYRGQMWHVVQDPSSNEFSRLSAPAYRLVAMLDGRRTVGDVWQMCNEQLGDWAPTQGEVIQLLGRLYSLNLLQAELSPDTEGMFRRYRKRVQREVRGYMASLLFAKIPLLDPDRFLERWVGIFGRVFTWYGLALWGALMAVGLFFLAGRFGELADRSANIFDPGSLPLLALSFWVVKIFHEFSHGFACKRFGRVEGSGGEVHTMGIMFLVFMPIPYVDASSAWAFRSKWRRVMVGASGIFMDLAIAAVAAVIWANVGDGTLRSVAYNAIFIASVSSLLFNGNPLLRYDAYYVLSDLVEIPNLAHRSKQYLYYLVKRYAWSVRRAQSPANTRGERAWFVFYGIASTVYRVLIFTMILLFISDRVPKQLAVVAVGFGAMAAFMWVGVPLGKFAHYLFTSGELARVRARAQLSTLGVALAVLIGVGLIPVPDRPRVEGLVEPLQQAWVHAESDGFITSFLPSGALVSAPGAALVNQDLQADELAKRTPEQLMNLSPQQWEALQPKTWSEANLQLWAKFRRLLAERQVLVAERRKAMAQAEHDPKYRALVQVLDKHIESTDGQIGIARKELVSLVLRARFAGRWVSPDIDRLEGVYLKRGDKIGRLISRQLVIRAVAGQGVPVEQLDRERLEIRVKGRPEAKFVGRIAEILPAGSDDLPSAALASAAGGSVQTDPEDRRGVKAARPFFEIIIVPAADAQDRLKLLPGQRVIVRLETPPKPLAMQAWRKLLQLLSRKKPRRR